MLKMTTGDRLVIGALLLTAALLLVLSLTVGGEDGLFAVITVDGETAARLPLDRNDTYTVESGRGTNVICVSDGAVFMKSASCPDKTCVHQGSISLTGEVIVCLPHRVTVSIDGNEDEMDAVSR